MRTFVTPVLIGLRILMQCSKSRELDYELIIENTVHRKQLSKFGTIPTSVETLGLKYQSFIKSLPFLIKNKLLESVK